MPDDRANNAMCPYCIGKGRDPFHKGRLCTACEGWGRLPDRKEIATTEGATRTGTDRPDVAAKGREERDPPPIDRATLPTDPLEDLLRDMVGDVEVCEPSLDEECLERLRLLRRCDLIRVLAHDVDAHVVPRIREFTRELPRFLFRRYGGQEIHDRYVLTPSEIVFLGPRAGDGNGRGSALIRVPLGVAREMIEDVRLGFDKRWSAGERLG